MAAAVRGRVKVSLGDVSEEVLQASARTPGSARCRPPTPASRHWTRCWPPGTRVTASTCGPAKGSRAGRNLIRDARPSASLTAQVGCASSRIRPARPAPALTNRIGWCSPSRTEVSVKDGLALDGRQRRQQPGAIPTGRDYPRRGPCREIPAAGRTRSRGDHNEGRAVDRADGAEPRWPDLATSTEPRQDRMVRVMVPTPFRRKNFNSNPGNHFRSVFIEKWRQRFSENSEIAHIVLYTAQ
jgi:hypothetical protein